MKGKRPHPDQIKIVGKCRYEGRLTSVTRFGKILRAMASILLFSSIWQFCEPTVATSKCN